MAEVIIEEDAEAAKEAALDDLATPLVKVKEKKPRKKKRVVVVKAVTEKVEEDETKASTRGKQLVFDEQSGQVVVKRKRKGSRDREDWEDIDDLDDLMEGEY